MKIVFFQVNKVKIYIIFTIFFSFSLEAKTTFIPRSQGDNTARELVGWQHQLFNNYDESYAAIASTLEYTRSFESERIAQKFFSTSSLTFSGSQQALRAIQEVVADQFGLATDFKGTLSIDPKIENVIIDMNFYAGLNSWCPGLYLRVNAPIVHTRWTLGLDSCLSCSESLRGCIHFPPCYMSTSPEVLFANDCTVPPRAITAPASTVGCPANTTLQIPSFIKNDCTAPELRDALSGNFIFGDMTEPWQAGKFSFCPRSKTGLADIDVSIGLNLLQNDCAHAGVFAVVVIPTGNRPKAHFIFEPIIGDGKHWHLGAGLSGHISLFPHRHDGCFNAGIYFDGRIVNVFKTDQIRSFDFMNNGLLSRYLLLKEFDIDGNYSGRLINAINFTTRNCEVSVGAQVDFSAKLFARYGGWEIDIGYNFFQRESEKICLKTKCPCPLDARNFGIKGVEGVCALQFDLDANGVVIASSETRRGLNTMQNNTTIFTSLLPNAEPEIFTDPESGETITALSWNSQTALAEDTPFTDLTIANGFVGAQLDFVPKRVTCDDLDISSAAQPRIKTNKIFGHINYTFKDGCYCPHIGIGAEGEFDSCAHNSLGQWGIWIKAGLSF